MYACMYVNQYTVYIYIYLSLSLFNDMIDSLNENHWDPNRLTNPPSRNGQMRNSDATRCQTSTNSPSLASALVRWKTPCAGWALWMPGTMGHHKELGVIVCYYVLLYIAVYILYYIYMCVFLYIYIYICVCFYIYIYVCMYVCVLLNVTHCYCLSYMLFITIGCMWEFTCRCFFGGQNRNPKIGFRTLAAGNCNLITGGLGNAGVESYVIGCAYI